MKLKYTFEKVSLGDEEILVPVGPDAEKVHGVLKMNTSGVEIVNMISEGMSEWDIIQKLAEKYENDRDELAGYVHDTVQILKNATLIEE